MKNVTLVKVSSRRSVNVDKEYLTYEMTLEADVSKLKSQEEIDKQVEEMYTYADDCVDKHIYESAKEIKGV